MSPSWVYSLTSQDSAVNQRAWAERDVFLPLLISMVFMFSLFFFFLPFDDVDDVVVC